MHRRRAESASQTLRETWTRSASKRGLFSKRLFDRHDGNSSGVFTDPTEESNSAIDFDLPNWEKPSDVSPGPICDRFPSPRRRTSRDEDHALKTGSTTLCKPPLNQPMGDEYYESDGTPANMLVTCNGSLNSLCDDITFSSLRDEEKYPTRPLRPYELHSRSLNFLSMTTSGTTDSKGFAWKRGPNGRFMKVPMGEEILQPLSRQPETYQESQNQPSESDLQRMEDEMLDRALALSRQESQQTLQVANSAVRISEAAPSSIHSRPVLNDTASVQTALQDQEEELVKLALERSLHESSSAPGHVSSGSTRRFGDAVTKDRNYRRVDSLNVHSAPRTSHVSRGPVTPRQEGKSFIWKKNKNNRYVKVPVPMDELREDCPREEFAIKERPIDRSAAESNDNERLQRMEEAFLEEALKRSMQDL